ncbi:hypothetical protein E5843_14445 [Luteimonas yindakuii]|uniref:hypothetical protein n=1 Tax=Luteimonas yindakuii TaxID=2565782 RepID=UPI0011077ADD|nr:hypothetical protein [Luteimonas yindakuii]QCU72525.1 hypothetical protein E5843_14445 [Luteimonas yindakuii]
MFGPSKDVLINQLVESWNEISHATTSCVRFFRSGSGWQWVVAMEILTYKDEVEIHVVLCSSQHAGDKLIEIAVDRPNQLGFSSAHRIFGPFMQLLDENLGVKSEARWKQDIDEYGRLRSRNFESTLKDSSDWRPTE